MGLPSGFISWDLNSGKHLQYGQQLRSFLLVRARAGAQDVCATPLFESFCPTYPLESVLSSSHGGRASGQSRCSLSSVWKRSALSGNASGMYGMSVVGAWRKQGKLLTV